MICAKHQSDGASCFVNELLQSEQVTSKVWCRQLRRQGPTNNYTPRAPDLLTAKPPTSIGLPMARRECATTQLNERKKKIPGEENDNLYCSGQLARMSAPTPRVSSALFTVVLSAHSRRTISAQRLRSQNSCSDPHCSLDQLADPVELLTPTPGFSYRHLSHRAVVRNSNPLSCLGCVSPQ